MNIHAIYGDDLIAHPKLRDEMLRDRGAQFRDALGWDLDVDEDGRELDVYDELNPLYLIATDEQGAHVGSTRLLPTTGRTMMADHFAHLTGGVAISSALSWEVTRFFVSNRAMRRAAPAIMWAGCRMALDAGVENYIGVTGAHMVRVFSACGWAPEIVGRAESVEGEICGCVWGVSEDLACRLARRAGIDPTLQNIRPKRDFAPAHMPAAVVEAAKPAH